MGREELARELGVWKNPWTHWWEFDVPGGSVGGCKSFDECLEAAMEWHVDRESRWSEVTYE